MSRLTRDGTAEPVSRDHILRRERGQGNINFPCSADHVQDWQPYPVDPYFCYMCDHTFMKNTTTTYTTGQRNNRAEQLADLTAPLRHRNPEPYTMLCAAREQCLTQDRTPQAPDGHLRRGVCGGRLHGPCGEVDDPDSDEPLHPIRQTCAIAKATATGSSSESKSTSTGKRKADNTHGRGNIGTRKKHASDSKSKSRNRLNFDQKIEVLVL